MRRSCYEHLDGCLQDDTRHVTRVVLRTRVWPKKFPLKLARPQNANTSIRKKVDLYLATNRSVHIWQLGFRIEVFAFLGRANFRGNFFWPDPVSENGPSVDVSATFVLRTPRWKRPGRCSTRRSDRFQKVDPAKKVSSKVGTPQKCEHFDSKKSCPYLETVSRQEGGGTYAHGLAHFASDDAADDDATDDGTIMTVTGDSAAPPANTSTSAAHSSIHVVSRLAATFGVLGCKRS